MPCANSRPLMRLTCVTRPRIALLANSGPDAERHMLAMLSTKYLHWQYEQEMRVFTNLQERDRETGLYFAGFSEHLELREVIVGHRSDLRRDELRDAIGDLTTRVKVHKARLAFNTFTVVRQRSEKHWK